MTDQLMCVLDLGLKKSSAWKQSLFLSFVLRRQFSHHTLLTTIINLYYLTLYTHISLYISQYLFLYCWYCWLVGWVFFVLVFCLSQKNKKNVRPDFKSQMDHGKPTPFTIRAGDKGNLCSKCFLSSTVTDSQK